MPESCVIEAAAATDPGPRFRQNQDAVALGGDVWSDAKPRSLVATGELLVAVADGVAMAPCASRASRTLLALLVDEALRQPGLPASLARRLQERITELAAGRPCEGMASTLAALRFADGRVHVLSVGDSRVYRWRDGRLHRVSTDHTVRQRMLRDGTLSPVEAVSAGSLYDDLDSAIVASSLEDRFDVFAHVEPLRPGDAWLCCTDGLTSVVAEEAIARVLAGTASPASKVGALMAAAMRAGGDDNVSAVVATVGRAVGG